MIGKKLRIDFEDYFVVIVIDFFRVIYFMWDFFNIYCFGSSFVRFW